MVTFCLETKMGQFTPETVVFKEAIDQYNWLYPASRSEEHTSELQSRQEN